MPEATHSTLTLPVLPLRDVVMFPGLVLPLFVGRAKSIEAIEAAMQGERKVYLVAQKNPTDDTPANEELYSIGVVASLLQMLKMPDGTVKILVEGETRAAHTELHETGNFFSATVEVIREEAPSLTDQAWAETVVAQFERYAKISRKIGRDTVKEVIESNEPSRLADLVTAQLPIGFKEKQEVLELTEIEGRLEAVLSILDKEIDLIEVERRIRDRVKKQMEKSQREYYLTEQAKVIQKELGDLDGEQSEIERFEEIIKSCGMNEQAETKARAELNKLRLMQPMSAEAAVVRNYLETLTGLPWKKKARVRQDLVKARTALDKEHFGLDEVKEQILEYLAVQKRVGKVRSSIMCLVGPPGVGKTSLGETISRATNRPFVRIALGGVRDEAEIRGHRRTYIGALPGKIIQKINQTGVRNPLILLDEIDKMGMDMRGDPASALLEVLDPEQNSRFNDHYLEVDFDLSDVMFICTSNSLNIPPALRDRMEIIQLSGYTEEEKLGIANQHLIRRQSKLSGVKGSELEITEDAVLDLIRHYTREAGVRNLERTIGKICRKVIKKNIETQNTATTTVGPDQLEDLLGVRKFSYGVAEKRNTIGRVTGLAWTEVGGELLSIETSLMPGKGQMICTGSLGDVMKESMQAALSLVRSQSMALGLQPDWYEKLDLHIHVPEGATPKDGPSAGIALVTAITSVATGIPVRSDVAMTGEVTLAGDALKIGGLKEKLLAAHRGGITTVLIPEDNRKDLKDIPENILEAFTIIPVSEVSEVLKNALETPPVPLEEPKISDESLSGRAH